MCVLQPPALIPVRLGPTAKRRLAHLLTANERAALVRDLLDHVVELLSVAGLRVIVLSPEATEVDGAAEVWTDEAPGLNAAVAAAIEQLGAPVFVVHADLPLLSIDDVETAMRAESDVVVARSYDGGTNGLLMRTLIRPAFGVGSAAMHADRARREGLSASVLDLPGFALDVDDEVGLSASGRAGSSPYTRP
jgi:2-phospho-L-lactate guanylyltransferase